MNSVVVKLAFSRSIIRSHGAPCEQEEQVLVAAAHTTFTGRVQSAPNFNPAGRPATGTLQISGQQLSVAFVRNPRAGRYVLRLRSEGLARVTIPRGGTVACAREFLQRNLRWLEQQLRRQAEHPRQPKPWTIGAEILHRGERTRIEAEAGNQIRFADESLPVADLAADLRPAIEGHLRSMAARELPPRVLELAGQHGFSVRRVTVRNQRTRWGSCSRRGVISLNWRLVQIPAFVRDYIILHELAHRRQMNHSARFWQEVERLCPDWRLAETWLKQHTFILH